MDADLTTLDRTATYVETQRAVATTAARLADAARNAARAQWTALKGGVAGEAIIDPEALLLVSLWLLPRDPALRVTVHDWIAQWSDLLSVQRTRNLAKAYSGEVQGELRAVAVTAQERGKDFRWSPIIKGSESGTRTSSAADSDAEAADGTLDDGRMPVERAALLVLRFRMALGVGARADALAYLLARGDAWSTVTEIAQATGYTPSAVRRALDRMAAAKIVLMVDDGATRYRCDPAPWAALLSLQAPVAPWQYWQQHFTFVATFVEWADGVARRKLTAYAITEGMRSVARKFRPTDDRDGLHAWDVAFRDGSTLAAMDAALAGVAAAMRSAA